MTVEEILKYLTEERVKFAVATKSMPVIDFNNAAEEEPDRQRKPFEIVNQTFDPC